MALAQAASYVEKAVGHGDNATVTQDISNPARDRAKYGHPTEKMQALCWMGKNTVKMSKVHLVSVAKAFGQSAFAMTCTV